MKCLRYILLLTAAAGSYAWADQTNLVDDQTEVLRQVTRKVEAKVPAEKVPSNGVLKIKAEILGAAQNPDVEVVSLDAGREASGRETESPDALEAGKKDGDPVKEKKLMEPRKLKQIEKGAFPIPDKR